MYKCQYINVQKTQDKNVQKNKKKLRNTSIIFK